MTEIQRITFGASAWQPRTAGAVMPITVTVAGRTTRLVPDLAHALADRLAFLTYADNCIPVDAAPQGTVSPEARIVGGLVVALESSQPAPEYADGSALPEVSDVRLLLTQPISGDLADTDKLLDWRESIEDVLATMNGAIGAPRRPPAPPPRRSAFSAAFKASQFQ